MSDFIRDITLILDNDYAAYTTVQEITLDHHDSGPTAVGDAIKEEFGPEDTSDVRGMIFGEFMMSVDSYELGEYYIESFADEIREAE